MNKAVKIAAGVAFAVAAGTAYEASQLNELVWSAPDIGDMEISRGGDVVDLTIDLDRTRSVLHREDLAVILNVRFKPGSDIPTEICVSNLYTLAGIFTVNQKSPLLLKHIASSPSSEADRSFFARYSGTEFNNRLISGNNSDCGDHLKTTYDHEMRSIILARKAALDRR